MNFNINKIVLWLNNGKLEIEFKPNKVNLITGGSHTGKSAILEIVDYCFFSSKSRISEDTINENILWYGINISVNDKTIQ
jgi:predicted ATP-binding protein involved in virulence